MLSSDLGDRVLAGEPGRFALGDCRCQLDRVRRGRGAEEPPTTTVISPRAPGRSPTRRARRASRAGPLRSVFVSSRHTAAGRSAPNAAARSAIVAASRCGASKNTSVRAARPASAASARRRCAERARQEAFEAEPIDRQSRDRQCGRHRRRSRQCGHRDSLGDGCGDQPETRVGHRGHPGVGHDQDVRRRRRVPRAAAAAARPRSPRRRRRPDRTGSRRGPGTAGAAAGCLPPR